MCGRYYMDIDDKEIKKIADEAENIIYPEYKTGEIFPSNVAPILIHGKEETRPILAKWGFPKWDGKGIIINARMESVNERQMFKNLASTNRCIVPASYYFEWKNEKTFKTKYMIKNPSSVLYMAGLYSVVRHKDRQLSLFDDNDTDIYYTIITKNAHPSLNYIHSRMPLIFDKIYVDDYLSGKNIKELLETVKDNYVSAAVK